MDYFLLPLECAVTSQKDYMPANEIHLISLSATQASSVKSEQTAKISVANTSAEAEKTEQERQVNI